MESKIFGRYLNRNRAIFVLTIGKENSSAYFASVKWVYFNWITSIFYVHSRDERGFKELWIITRLYSPEKN